MKAIRINIVGNVEGNNLPKTIIVPTEYGDVAENVANFVLYGFLTEEFTYWLELVEISVEVVP